jgi:flagellar biosynthetic protein FlhB
VAKTDQKTEKPTQKRKRDARREGTVAKSPEVAVAFSLVTALFAMRLIGPSAVDGIMTRSRVLLAHADSLPSGEVGSLALGMIMVALVPFLAVAVVSGLSSGIAQVGFTVATKAAKPKFSNLSPKKGLERFKPAKMGWELVRNVIKLALLGLIMWEPLTSWVPNLAAPLGLANSLEILSSGVWGLLARAAFLAVLIAAVDYGVNKRRTMREMKMSRQDLKQEMKSAEGDPTMRSRRRRRHQELSRNRMIAMVGTADVLLTNPTRLAVALVYHSGEPAPTVIAKGSGKMAKRLREEARRNGVPVIEDKPLARTLFRLVQVGGLVPTQLFEAVAAILAVAYRRRRRAIA